MIQHHSCKNVSCVNVHHFMQPPFVATYTAPVSSESVKVTWNSSTSASERSSAEHSSHSSADESTNANSSDITVQTGSSRRGTRTATSASAVPPPTVFAVISLGGTQYKVTIDDIINAEYIPTAEVGTTLRVSDVHVVGTATHTLIGRPTLSCSVECAVEEHTVESKDVVFKKRRRKRYQRTKGHRRIVTRLRVLSINVDAAAGVTTAKTAVA